MNISKGNELDSKSTITCKHYFLLFLIICGFIIGLYFLIQSFLNPQSEEIAKLNDILTAWEQNLPWFSNISFVLKSGSNEEINLISNPTDFYAESIVNFPNYTHLTYTTSAILYSNSTEKLNYKDKEYDITTTIILSVIINNTEIENILYNVPIHSKKYFPASSKVCRNNNKGFWDPSINQCLYQYNTIEICVIVNNTGYIDELYHNGCYNQEYFVQATTPWSTDKEFNEFQYQTFIVIRNEFDPLVYAHYNSLTEFSLSANEYKIIGIITLGVCILMMAALGIYSYCIYKNNQYLNLANDEKITDSA